MAMKYSLQVGVRRSIFIVMADTIVFLMMYVIADQLSAIYNKNSYFPYIIYGFNYIILFNLPAFFHKGCSWGMILYDVKLLRKAQPLSLSLIVLRSLLFLPVYISYIVGLLLLLRRKKEPKFDPLFQCYILLNEPEYINEEYVAGEDEAEVEIITNVAQEKNFGRKV